MRAEVVNKNRNCVFDGPYAGRDLLYITIYQESERKFVVTHNTNIKPVFYFTGRETELKDLRQRIEDGRKSVLVSGMGGIGKTQICRKLFNEYCNEQSKGKNEPFRHIGYIEYSGDMDNSLMNCLRYKEQDNPELNQEAAWKELEDLASKGKLLLFVDNVNKTMVEDPGLQRLNHIPGAIMITSRSDSFSDEFEPYKIGFLDTEQCKEIYEKIRFENSGRKIKLEEVQDLEYVIESLVGRHTITVGLLAHLAYIKIWTAKKLREELEKKGFQLQFHKNGELVNIQKSYEVLYDLSMLTEAEQNILEAFSMFPYIPLAAETCNQWLLTDAGVSKDDDTLMGLYQKGWLQFDMEQENYILHPVFAQFIYEKCKPRMENHSGLIDSCQQSLKIPDNGSILLCQQYVLFAENIIDKVNMGICVERARFITSLAWLLQYMAEYEKAEKLYWKILNEYKVVWGEYHLNTANIYHHLACVYENQGKYEKAKKYYKESLYIQERQEKMSEENYLDIASSYNNLAGVYESQGEYEEAKEIYKKSLYIRKKILGEDHKYTANSYNNLAIVYEKQGKYEIAEELFKISLYIREKVLGKKHPDTASSYNNLAYIYYIRHGRNAEAIELFKKTLQIDEEALGKNHPNIANIYNNLAIMYMEQGEYKKAKELLDNSLYIRKNIFSNNHPDIAGSYISLANLYRKQGKYIKAKELYEESLQILRKILGDEHPNIANIYNNLVNVNFNLRDYKNALVYCFKAYKIFFKKLGFDHPDTTIIYENLKLAYTKGKNENNFEQWLEEKMKEPE